MIVHQFIIFSPSYLLFPGFPIVYQIKRFQTLVSANSIPGI